MAIGYRRLTLGSTLALLAWILTAWVPATGKDAVLFPPGVPWYNVSHPLTRPDLRGRAALPDFFNNALRRLNPASGKVTTMAQNPGQPQALAVLSPNTLPAAESSADRIVAVRLPSRKIYPRPLAGLSPSYCKEVTP